MYFGTERTLSRMFVTPIDMNRHLIDENTKRCGDQKVVSCTSPIASDTFGTSRKCLLMAGSLSNLQLSASQGYYFSEI